MEFDSHLVGKILDPIHGIIRLTELELQFIDHPLFQRLRNIRQNSFVYKVFPSATHSRFEHSLGVMHLSYMMLNHLKMNASVYPSENDQQIFTAINALPASYIQELRLAALLHDIGHGPMSHQFDLFMPKKEQMKDDFDERYADVFSMMKDNEKVEHESISMLFIHYIYNQLASEFKEKINIDNVIKIIDSRYKDQEITLCLNRKKVNILPLFSSMLSSCPIDVDRMDYLWRDSYFSGVKCGIYDYNRLFMTVLPLVSKNSVFLAYKKSGMDSVIEFVYARSSLYAQVYYHKTIRAFSAMLACIYLLLDKNDQLDHFISLLQQKNMSNVEGLLPFYLKNTDDYFLQQSLPDLIVKTDLSKADQQISVDVLNAIYDRKPWISVYESIYSPESISITQTVNENFIESLTDEFYLLLEKKLNTKCFAVDIAVDNTFKDIYKTNVKLIDKDIFGDTFIREFADYSYGHNHTIKYFIRIFMDKKKQHLLTKSLIKALQNKENELIADYFQ